MYYSVESFEPEELKESLMPATMRAGQSFVLRVTGLSESELHEYGIIQ